MTEEEKAGWKVDPVTKKVFAEIIKRIDDIKEEWALGHFSSSERLESKKIGEVEGLRGIFDIVHEEEE